MLIPLGSFHDLVDSELVQVNSSLRDTSSDSGSDLLSRVKPVSLKV